MKLRDLIRDLIVRLSLPRSSYTTPSSYDQGGAGWEKKDASGSQSLSQNGHDRTHVHFGSNSEFPLDRG